MDANLKAQIAARIDRLLRLPDVDDKTINVEVSTALRVSAEAVRQWRKNIALPKLENVFGLVMYLASRGIETTPEYVLFGLQKGLPSMQLRERIVEDGEELDLLRLYRGMNRDGQKHLMANAMALQLSFPRASNVQDLHSKKKKQK